MFWPEFVGGLVMMALAVVQYRFRVPWSKINRDMLDASFGPLGRRPADASTTETYAWMSACLFAMGVLVFVLSFFPQASAQQ